MEIIRNNNNGAMAAGAVVALAAGAVLMVFSLSALPDAPAWGFPWAFCGAIASLVLIAVGGWCMGTLVRRRRDETARYGKDESSGNVVFALWVILAGVLLLAFNSGVLPMEWRRVFFSWQMILLLVGASEFARGRFVGGAICLAIGGYFITNRLDGIYSEMATLRMDVAFWPLLLIVVGALILGGILCKSACRGTHRRSCDNKVGSRRASGVIDINSGFGGSEEVYLDPEFQGGKISTFFGGVKLDLRRTGLPEGDTLLKVESFFGGVEILAPEGWNIDLRTESLFGGFTDNRFAGAAKTYDDGRKLIIKASSFFGGGEIK